MELEKHYLPEKVEARWYQYWLEGKYFESVPDDREPFTIVIPPPNVTGVLHMGHMLNNTIQDILIRKARMEGKNACWVPGTDHASIATEAKVVQKLKEEGVSKNDIGREEFLRHAWDWKEKYGGIILDQLKKLGASCDWNRTRFTMEEDLSKAVIKSFVKLYNKGLIYRDTKMVNWDPEGKTTLSDEEVIYKENQATLYYVKYKGENPEDFIQVATTRPETILGDVAVCVNPNDERYRKLIGKKVCVPFVNRWVEVIADDYVDPEFGTGCLKITPAHDINDYLIGLKFGLEVLDVLDESGLINYPGSSYHGTDRFKARKQMAKQLEDEGLLINTETTVNKVGHSERTGAIIEPKISTQWFMNMEMFMKQNPEVLDAVMNDEIKIYPEKLKNTYRHWIENIRDWNISRQLWWGHRIPAWYDDKGKIWVGENAEEAHQQFWKQNPDKQGVALTQDEDVLDTWFSSWLWPISVFNGFDPDSKDFKYYYPTSDLVTGPDIIFFWVARMVMAGYEFAGEKPFKNVYFTGIVRDKLGRKMSKSLGNSPDPLDLISNYGADGTRMGILLSAPAGNDILFDEALVEQGRNFCNKLWNAYRLISNWESDKGASSENYQPAIQWFDAKLELAIQKVHESFKSYKLSEALMTLYKLAWDDFCSWYLEMLKPTDGKNLPADVLEKVKLQFAEILKLLHPFMPFITEELYHSLNGNNPEKPIIVSEYPKQSTTASNEIDERPLKLISEVRNVRKKNNIPNRDKLSLFIQSSDTKVYKSFQPVIEKLAGVDSVQFSKPPTDSTSFLVEKDEIGLPISQWMNLEDEKKKLEDEINYLKGFLKSVEAKLNNQNFMAHAKPEIVEKEKAKQADAEEKINKLKESLSKL
jgi:valyl-tRNA synthetase